MSSQAISLSRRLRQSPYFDRVLESGVKGFTVYNHMLLPTVFRSLEEDYWHLVSAVQLWDVAVERQIRVSGSDSLRLIQYITPRDVSGCRIGRCMYAPLVDDRGGIVNDPVLLRISEDTWWLSIADSDVLLWLRGLVHGLGLKVDVDEPDISPLAVQGPLAEDVIATIFGQWIRDIRFFRTAESEVNGIPVLLARSGWSKQGGFEIYLKVRARGIELWDIIAEAGAPFGIRAGCPNLIERIENGLLSYGNDITLENNPLECGLDRYCNFDKPADYMARDAITRIRQSGVTQRLVNLEIAGSPMAPNDRVWRVTDDRVPTGLVTSAVWSPAMGKNIAFAMIMADRATVGAELTVELPDGNNRPATVVGDNWSSEAALQ